MARSETRQLRKRAWIEKKAAEREAWLKMTPAERRAKTYRDRNRLLRDLGFPDYQAYLASKLWRSIREATLTANPTCWSCPAKSTQVHHLAYTKAVLLGKKPKLLRALCADCHREAEFRNIDGEKLATYQANIKLGNMRAKRQKTNAERIEQEEFLTNRIQSGHRYLIRHHKPQVAHIWDGSDTACRMFSTGGMVQLKYGTIESPGDLRICQVCLQKSRPDQREHAVEFQEDKWGRLDKGAVGGMGSSLAATEGLEKEYRSGAGHRQARSSEGNNEGGLI